MSQRKINILIILLTTILFFVFFYDRIVHVNGPATAAVVFKPFNGGVDIRHVDGEGVFFTWPWDNYYTFSVAEKMVERNLEIVVQNGITVTMQINFRYKPIQKGLPVIFQEYGVKYEDVFVTPEVISCVRQLISAYTPEEIYTTHPDTVRRAAMILAAKKLAVGYVNLYDLNIMHITLPAKVSEAIEAKMEQEEISLSWDYKKEIAQKEKEIKVIEAQGTLEATRLIDEGLTGKYLKFKQIEAFEKMSISPNAKTIIIPSGTNPSILLNEEK